MSRRQVAGGLMILNAEAVAAGQASQQIIIRTRFWDDALLDAQDDGVSQVVILAAGMDARAYRLPWRAGTTVYEVDQPRVIAAKDERLAGERPRCRRLRWTSIWPTAGPKRCSRRDLACRRRRCGWLRGCGST
jgi:methyltransferase (TIGR00027 family)